MTAPRKARRGRGRGAEPPPPLPLPAAPHPLWLGLLLQSFHPPPHPPLFSSGKRRLQARAREATSSSSGRREGSRFCKGARLTSRPLGLEEPQLPQQALRDMLDWLVALLRSEELRRQPHLPVGCGSSSHPTAASSATAATRAPQRAYTQGSYDAIIHPDSSSASRSSPALAPPTASLPSGAALQARPIALPAISGSGLARLSCGDPDEREAAAEGARDRERDFVTPGERHLVVA